MPSDWATVKHEIEGTFTQCKFLSLQCPSVERTHCILLYVYGLVVTDCASLAAAFLAANAHSVVPPLVKKSRSARLFAYKCAHNASLSLPTFCRFKRLGIVPFRLQGTKTHLRRKFQSVRQSPDKQIRVTICRVTICFTMRELSCFILCFLPFWDRR